MATSLTTDTLCILNTYNPPPPHSLPKELHIFIHTNKSLILSHAGPVIQFDSMPSRHLLFSLLLETFALRGLLLFRLIGFIFRFYSDHASHTLEHLPLDPWRGCSWPLTRKITTRPLAACDWPWPSPPCDCWSRGQSQFPNVLLYMSFPRALH